MYNNGLGRGALLDVAFNTLNTIPPTSVKAQCVFQQFYYKVKV